MRNALVAVTGLVLVAACSKAPANSQADSTAPASAAPASAAAAASAAPVAPAASGPAVSGTFTIDGKTGALAYVTTHKDDPFDGKPIVDVIFTAKDPAGDADASTDALFAKLGDAIVVKVEPDGTVVEAEVVHSALKNPNGSVSVSGVLTVKNYQASGGQISGELTSGGPTDLFDQKLNIDLTFHTAAP